jgi:hypothetical protein
MIRETLDSRARWWRDLPARTALRFCNQRQVRTILGRRHERELQRHRPDLPALDEPQRRIVDAINQHGICRTSIESLGLQGSDLMMADGLMLAERFAAEARALSAKGKEFMIIPPEQIVAHSNIFHWGLQDRLLDIAEAYIGLPPAYDGVAINYTVADGREISTRKWHQDWEDRRILKVAVYLHDVTETGGPFQMISRRDAQQSDASGYSYELAEDMELGRRFGPTFNQDIVSCEGPKGTVIFTDTARFFHRGKPATGRDRAAVFYSYFARNPRHPFLCERTGMSRSDMYRMASELPPRQQESVLWRRKLPLPLRLIPPATL